MFFISFSHQRFTECVLCNGHCQQTGTQGTEKADNKTHDEMQYDQCAKCSARRSTEISYIGYWAGTGLIILYLNLNGVELLAQDHTNIISVIVLSYYTTFAIQISLAKIN